jgi:hypothetical protein
LEKSKSFTLVDIVVVDKVAPQSSDAANIRFMGLTFPFQANEPVFRF